jgi:hypothetical protein
MAVSYTHLCICNALQCNVEGAFWIDFLLYFGQAVGQSCAMVRYAMVCYGVGVVLYVGRVRPSLPVCTESKTRISAAMEGMFQIRCTLFRAKVLSVGMCLQRKGSMQTGCS